MFVLGFFAILVGVWHAVNVWFKTDFYEFPAFLHGYRGSSILIAGGFITILLTFWLMTT